MKKTVYRFIFLLVVLVAAYILNRLGFLQKTLDWIESFGAWGPVLFVLVYVLSCVFLVPSFVFTFSGGILFGVLKGTLLSLAGVGLGSLAAFLIGRYLAYDFVAKRIAGNREFERLGKALRKKGWKVILLARFSPVFPFLVGNYAFGVTQIRAVHYFLASIFGSIPSTLVYTYLGFVTGDVAQFNLTGRSRTMGEWILLGAGLTATVGLAWYLRRLAEKDIEEISS